MRGLLAECHAFSTHNAPSAQRPHHMQKIGVILIFKTLK
jgi:hypothetical protein